VQWAGTSAGTLPINSIIKNNENFISIYSIKEKLMKKIHGLFFLLSLLFMGCSSTYTIKDFTSKDKFYEDFNSSAKSKDVNITLMNDSSFTINDGVVLENGILFSVEGKDKKSFPLSDVAEIKYTKNDSASASIFLNNGGIYRGKNITTGSDSIYFTVTTSTAKNNTPPMHIGIDKVKTVTYKTWLRSSLVGLLSGGIAGGIVVLIAHSNLKDNPGVATNYDILAPPIGALVGGIIGGIIGWNTIYQFNP
jgi:hypothetical protein